MTLPKNSEFVISSGHWSLLVPEKAGGRAEELLPDLGIRDPCVHRCPVTVLLEHHVHLAEHRKLQRRLVLALLHMRLGVKRAHLRGSVMVDLVLVLREVGFSSCSK